METNELKRPILDLGQMSSDVADYYKAVAGLPDVDLDYVLVQPGQRMPSRAIVEPGNVGFVLVGLRTTSTSDFHNACKRLHDKNKSSI